MTSLSIFVFNWNTQSSVFKNKLRFIEKLKEKIERHDLLIFSLQEDSIRDSTIFSSLKTELDELYTEIHESEMSGWGITTYKSMKYNLEYKPRGLRLIVFKKRDLILEISSFSKSYVCPSLKNKITWGKGSIVIFLEIEKIGKLAIANCHLPFNSKSLKDKESRKKALEIQIKALEIINDSINEYNPDYTLLMGDLNFRVFGDLDALKIAEKISNKDYSFIEYDELRNNVKIFKEGIEDKGPLFPPTCKLFQKRNYYPGELVYNLGKYRQRVPSWCDRILYKNLECCSYYSFDEYEIRYSDHMSVIGEFILWK